MLIEDVLVFVIAGALTILALVAAVFIAAEAINVIRELQEDRQRVLRISRALAQARNLSPGDTQPLVRRIRARGGRADGRSSDAINPLRDRAVVKQMIHHFEDDEVPAADS